MLLRDAKIYLDKYDLSGDHNMVTLNVECNAVPNTTFGSTTETAEAGLFKNAASGQVLVTYGAGEVDDVLFGKIAVANTPITISPDGGNAGEVAYFMQALQAAYTPIDGTVGDLHVAKWAAQGDGGKRMVRGTIFYDASSTFATTGSSSVIALGAVSSSQRLFAALHVISASGTSPTLTVTVKSDAASDMASPATPLTFTQATAATAELISVAGPITDEYYRVDLTVGGTSPVFRAVVVVGIV